MRIVLVKNSVTIICDCCLYHLFDNIFEAFSCQNFASPPIENLPLVVHHLIVFEQALAYLVVSLFDFFLCLFDALAYPFMCDWLSLFPANPRKCLDSPFRRKNPHQVILKTQKELAGAGVTLPAASPSKLIVDSSGLVPLRAEYVQSADFSNALAEFDIRAAPCHIRCDCYIASHSAVPAFMLMAGFGNYHCFSVVMFGVEKLVLQPESFR